MTTTARYLALGALGAGLLGVVYMYAPRDVPGLLHPLGPDGRRFRITSPYGLRIHPIDKIPKPHNGIDFGTPTGTPVYAVAPGEVYEVIDDPNNSGGRQVKLRHDGYRYKYLHLDRVAVGLGPVERGTVLGYTGATGRVTGPHLHFEVASDVGNVPIDPAAVFGAGVFA